MVNSGKQLEHLAREIEKRFLPAGFEVFANERVINSGVQIAEFDIVVKGNLGLTPFKWLIECRDRQSRGPAPGAWIEQLIGRKHLFKFDKVTAISTSGFSKGAKGLAELGNIELRSVRTLEVDSIKDWFPLSTVEIYSIYLSVEHITFVGDGDNNQVQEEVVDWLKSQSTCLNTNMSMPVHQKTGEPLNVIADFYNNIYKNPHLLNEFEANGKAKPIKCVLKYSNPTERYQFITKSGTFHITEVKFEGKLTFTASEVLIAQITEYYKTSTEEPIAQSIRFTTEVGDRSVDLFFHNLGEKDKTFISAKIEMVAKVNQNSANETMA